ncbi:MAG: hypothetical protein U9N04_00105, partial [Patescibacteria group bacterium]|nr:hypothetical protein [Patescibacteria group bacterium]
YDLLQRGNNFYFTVLGIFITTFFLTITSETESKNLIVAMLVLFYIAIAFSWYGHSQRTYVKLMSKLERARHIETYFAKEYGEFMQKLGDGDFQSKHYSEDNFLKECFQNFTFTTRHLDEDKDCRGNNLDFPTKRNSFLVTKFPFILLIILLFGMLSQCFI